MALIAVTSSGSGQGRARRSGVSLGLHLGGSRRRRRARPHRGERRPIGSSRRQLLHLSVRPVVAALSLTGTGTSRRGKRGPFPRGGGEAPRRLGPRRRPCHRPGRESPGGAPLREAASRHVRPAWLAVPVVLAHVQQGQAEHGGPLTRGTALIGRAVTEEAPRPVGSARLG